MAISPTQRTLAELRRLGRRAEIVEKWQINPRHPAGGYRKDLFGFIDIICLDPERGIIGVQSCGQNFSEHSKTIMDSDVTQDVLEWIKCGGALELWGWRKVKIKRGGKAMRWEPRIAEYKLDKNGQIKIKGG